MFFKSYQNKALAYMMTFFLLIIIFKNFLTSPYLYVSS